MTGAPVPQTRSGLRHRDTDATRVLRTAAQMTLTDTATALGVSRSRLEDALGACAVSFPIGVCLHR